MLTVKSAMIRQRYSPGGMSEPVYVIQNEHYPLHVAYLQLALTVDLQTVPSEQGPSAVQIRVRGPESRVIQETFNRVVREPMVITIPVTGFKCREPGTYTFEIVIDNKSTHLVPLSLI